MSRVAKAFAWEAMMAATVRFGWRERARAAQLDESLHQARAALAHAQSPTRTHRQSPCSHLCPAHTNRRSIGNSTPLSAGEQTTRFAVTDKLKDAGAKKVDALEAKLQLNTESKRPSGTKRSTR